LAAQDFVADGGGAELHGTAVAGVIVARSDPAVGLVGVAPGARLLPLRACWEITRDGAVCSSFTLAKALQYALRHDVRVINLSLTGPHDLLLARLIDRAVAHGIVVVAAAQDEAADPGFPASQAEVIAVLARPPPVATRKELLAPGVEVLTTTPQATFGFMSGSSFAAAHVSGLAALLLEASPRSTPAQVNALLERTGSAVAASAGVALVHPCAALMAFISEGALPRCGTQQAADLEASRDGIDTH
jgi:subtilisin family serine protease